MLFLKDKAWGQERKSISLEPWGMLAQVCYDKGMPIETRSDQEHSPDLFVMTRYWMVFGFMLACLTLILIGCGEPQSAQISTTATVTPSATLRPSLAVPSVTPTIVPTHTPTPTITPEPTLRVNVGWPAQISPLEPVAVDVTFDPTPVDAQLTVTATVLQPTGERYAVFDLRPEPDGLRSNSPHYVATEPLQLPLMPVSGTWWLVVHVETPYSLTGSRVRYFTVTSPSFRNLTDVLPAQVTIQVPEAFESAVAIGDRQAGGRVWTHAGGALELWWTPGPAEDLTLTTAQMAVGATHITNPRILSVPEIASSEATTWQTSPAYRFEERWEDALSVGTAWVIQDDEDWLYVLRLRPPKDGDMPHLLASVAETLTFQRPGD
jgi:hypothetical protein